MNLIALNEAILQFKTDLEHAITTGTFAGRQYASGWEAKQALIRSSSLIMRIHEVVKTSLRDEFETANVKNASIHPPIGHANPELKVVGFIKAKKQDVVAFAYGDHPKRERITEGPLEGEIDPLGESVSNHAIVIGIRSQMSSVDKNFDTLMERAFAETLNLRLRLPQIVMGEVYLLPIAEYDDKAMKRNLVQFKQKTVRVVKFIKTFLAISGREACDDQNEIYKYERSALVLVDLRQNNPLLFTTTEELKQADLLPADSELRFETISPLGFAKDIVAAHQERHRHRK